MTNKEILQIALTQSAFDCNCNTKDFECSENKIFISKENKKAKKYLKLPFLCHFVSYGNNIIASVSEEVYQTIIKDIKDYNTCNFFDIANIEAIIKEYKINNYYMLQYFLPDIETIKPLNCNYECKLLNKQEFENLYLPEWSNALSQKRPHLDKLVVGAYDNGKLIGLAGCSADCDTMWQIGVDVLPEYRKQGIASYLTSKLALECFKINIIPFYSYNWSNIKSYKNAVKSGFKPLWVEMNLLNKNN